MTIVDPMRPVKRRPPPQPVVVSKLAVTAEASAPRQKSDRKRRISLSIILIALMGGSLLVIPELLGQILLIVYALVVLIRRQKPHMTFVLAVIFLALSPLMDIVGGEGNAGVLASYSFFFLLIGLLQLIADYRRLVKGRTEQRRLKQ